MARLLYRPFGIIAGIIAGKLAGTLFESLWTKLDKSGDPPPDHTYREISGAKAVSSAALQAATFAGTKAAVDRASLKWFEHLTGLWAGKKPDPEESVAA